MNVVILVYITFIIKSKGIKIRLIYRNIKSVYLGHVDFNFNLYISFIRRLRFPY